MYQAEANMGLEQTVSEAYPSVSVKPANVVVVPNDKLVFTLSEDGRAEANARAHLVIHNPTDQSIIYKFKTNAGKANVGVRPCVGVIHPGEKAEAEVNLGFAERSDVEDLKILVVTAVAPQFDCDLKSVWKNVASHYQNITKVRCVVNTDPMPTSSHGCYINKSMVPTDNEMQAYNQSSYAHSQHQVTAAAPPPPPQPTSYHVTREAPPYQPHHQSAGPPPPPATTMTATATATTSAPKSKTLAAVLETDSFEGPAPVCQFDDSCVPDVGAADSCLPARPRTTRYYAAEESRNIFSSNSRVATEQGVTGAGRLPQPLMQYEQQQQQQQQPYGYEYCEAAEGGDDNVGYQSNVQGDMGQGKKPTSYFVDVSPIAEREMRGNTPTTYFGIDKNNVLQVFLMAAAGIAAAKLFLE